LPLYQYQCEKCGFEMELQQKINDDAPYCSHSQIEPSLQTAINGFDIPSKMKKVIGKSTFVLKGKWFKTGGY
jgi:putative FmdB family regulatory protein